MLSVSIDLFFTFLIELQRHNRLVLSARWWTLQDFIAWLRSFIYNKNGRGPRADPWGTSQFIAARPDSYPFIKMSLVELIITNFSQALRTIKYCQGSTHCHLRVHYLTFYHCFVGLLQLLLITLQLKSLIITPVFYWTN